MESELFCGIPSHFAKFLGISSYAQSLRCLLVDHVYDLDVVGGVEAQLAADDHHVAVPQRN